VPRIVQIKTFKKVKPEVNNNNKRKFFEIFIFFNNKKIKRKKIIITGLKVTSLDARIAATQGPTNVIIRNNFIKKLNVNIKIL